MARGYGIGASLATMGQQQQGEAMEMLGRAASMEQERNQTNRDLRAQRKAGNVQLGSTVGAMGGMALGMKYGSAGGPWGAAIGAVVGGIAGSLF